MLMSKLLSVTIHTTTQGALGSFYFLRTSDWDVCLYHLNRIKASVAKLERQWIQTYVLKESKNKVSHQVWSI